MRGGRRQREVLGIGSFFGSTVEESTNSQAPAVEIQGLSRATAIAAGPDHVCAITEDAGVYCLGENNAGQLGNYAVTRSYVPIAVPALGNGVLAVAAGAQHSCAAVGRKIRCWGSNDSGRLGAGYTDVSATPLAVEGRLREPLHLPLAGA